MAEKHRDKANSITVFGNGAYYAEHAGDAGRDVVRAVVGLCRRGGEHATLSFGEGGAYAYPHPGGDVAWGLEGRYGFIARGVQLLPADARPGIHDLDDLAQSWRELSDVPATTQNSERAKDLLAAARWQHTAANAWLQAAGLSNAELIEAQAHLDVIGTGLDEVERTVVVHSADENWVTGFDAAGWPNVPHQSVALTLSAFMLQLYEDAAQLDQGKPAQQQNGPEQQGRGR